MDDSRQIEDWERAADQPDMPVELVRRLTSGGRDRAIIALGEARRLNDAGFPGPALLWALDDPEHDTADAQDRQQCAAGIEADRFERAGCSAPSARSRPAVE